MTKGQTDLAGSRQIQTFFNAFLERTRREALREKQTLRAGCSKTEPKNFAPPQTPFPGTHGGQNLMFYKHLGD